MRIIISIIATIILFILTISFYSYQPFVEGERRYATYTGVVLEFEINCYQCCHPASHFSINTTNGIKSELIGNCDDDLQYLIHTGNIYTIKIEPYAEPYAITHSFGEPGSYWAVKIDWVKDSNNNIIWGNEWI